MANNPSNWWMNNRPWRSCSRNCTLETPQMIELRRFSPGPSTFVYPPRKLVWTVKVVEQPFQLVNEQSTLTVQTWVLGSKYFSCTLETPQMQPTGPARLFPFQIALTVPLTITLANIYTKGAKPEYLILQFNGWYVHLNHFQVLGQCWFPHFVVWPLGLDFKLTIARVVNR